MKLYKRIGLLFTLLCVVSLAVNLFTVSNPDHGIDLFLCCLFAFIFQLSSMVQERAGQVIQTTSLSVASFFPLLSTDSFFFAGAIAVTALTLIYTYGGYHTYPFWKLPATALALFASCFSASFVIGGLGLTESTIRAFAWTFFIALFCFLLWLMVRDIEIRFHQQIKTEIDRDRVELENIKKQVGGCDDGDSQHNP